ncbi:MAG: hypothetical protein KGJ84_05710 [Elusimicrobia bacterium]|nr:hypothetical protein [Elusimicrobiota bacterium]
MERLDDLRSHVQQPHPLLKGGAGSPPGRGRQAEQRPDQFRVSAERAEEDQEIAAHPNLSDVSPGLVPCEIACETPQQVVLLAQDVDHAYGASMKRTFCNETTPIKDPGIPERKNPFFQRGVVHCWQGKTLSRAT